MAHPMTVTATRSKRLAHGTRTGKVATTPARRPAHIAPVWFVVDGDDLVFMTGADDLKGKTLRRDPRVALVVDLEEQPTPSSWSRARSLISTDLEEMLPLSIRDHQALRASMPMSPSGSARRNAVEGELLVRTLHLSRMRRRTT